jgi:hypothetical protein
VHLLEPTLTIVPDHDDAYFSLTAPTEAVQGAGDEVLDFSGLFQDIEGAVPGRTRRSTHGRWPRCRPRDKLRLCSPRSPGPCRRG